MEMRLTRSLRGPGPNGPAGLATRSFWSSAGRRDLPDLNIGKRILVGKHPVRRALPPDPLHSRPLEFEREPATWASGL